MTKGRMTSVIAETFFENREFKKLPRQLQRKRHVRIELFVRLRALRLFHVVHVKKIGCLSKHDVDNS